MSLPWNGLLILWNGAKLHFLVFEVLKRGPSVFYNL